MVLILCSSNLIALKATFGAGCFWHVEDLLAKTKGVKSTQVGYTGGQLPDPTYEEVIERMYENVSAEGIELENYYEAS